MPTIALEVDDDIAQRYATASKEDRLRMQILIKLQLDRFAFEPRRPISEIMDEMSRKAQERGLTPEILESLLKDE